jgi:hypothetical protein
MSFNVIKNLARLLLVSAILAGCNATPPTPSAPTPLAQRDLSNVVMQPNELASGFGSVTEEKFDDVFPNTVDAHTGVVNSYVVYSKTSDSKRVYSSGIAVYQDASQAIKAFLAIKDGTKGGILDVPEIGDQHYAMTDVIESDLILNKIYMSLVLWRYKESILYVSAADNANPPNTSQLVSLAQKIQERWLKP